MELWEYTKQNIENERLEAVKHLRQRGGVVENDVSWERLTGVFEELHRKKLAETVGLPESASWPEIKSKLTERADGKELYDQTERDVYGPYDSLLRRYD
ncbi:MAG: hypothetical protein A2750_03515 [Candidatus Yanofskybacteria bacterium RIFCSPHIGHO2_01_FULL_45_42]|uniref:Uncharacterized protein n=3 Tax=Candidatus Yanofskyibacteriota TaxID=1752733 RepID=A0A1F8F078_9BACT|nr:MAG: hypothetical protein A2750_03515 [Candidatus Yanofskybacteria bacterium RIFCSPHIGHO2_01_FULL_45_42]OGN16139.1 MAG: hypothetical protein A3C81_01005 [Candidatus Yanofskybacteria bacterium RIFCSPHIGHO2_02_FULL_46_19]OGN26241.1 MAG: hypothetical protein A3B17_02655 [Candidatus Yanofskybacteria bacterium RIFCSPLOWO2_01_FULL_45_72]OGN31793.1 MAG: hypothetical protein A3J01_03320 [Candidatus Yanofskybacteria bacterium RIFCSPLOWO2_02_FULL_45_18]